MIIALASGKGGTGKTIVATNLAVTACRNHTVAYLDCDVEEPNGAIFLKPRISEDRLVGTPIPLVDNETCNGCGKCSQICQYSAIVTLGKTVLTFPELCHGCAGCWLVCPVQAISKGQHNIGRLQSGTAGKVAFVQGLLDVGQAMSPPVIRAVKSAMPQADLVFIDCPPGTSCPVIESLKKSDYVLLVTEPTPFGLHDLKLAVETVEKLEIPFGVVINRAGSGDLRTQQFCKERHIAILAEIADDREVAEAYSRGKLACKTSHSFRQTMEKILTLLLQKEKER